MTNKKAWLLVFLVLGFVGCDGTKTIWFKGYVERAPEDRLKLSTSFVYETMEDGEKVEKRRGVTVWPNGKFLVNIKAQDYLYIERLPFSTGEITYIKLKLEGEDFKRQLIDLGTFYAFDSIIEIPKNYNGNFTDLSFEIVSNAFNFDYFDVFINKIEAIDTKGPMLAIVTSRFIDINGLRNTKVSISELLDLAKGADSFMMDEARITIHKEFEPGLYDIEGRAIRMIDEEPVTISDLGTYYPGILEISEY